MFRVAAEGKSKGPFHFFMVKQTSSYVEYSFSGCELSYRTIHLNYERFFFKHTENQCSIINLCVVGVVSLLSSTEIADLYRNSSTKTLFHIHGIPIADRFLLSDSESEASNDNKSSLPSESDWTVLVILSSRP